MSNTQNKPCKHDMLIQKLALIFTLITASTMSAAELKWQDSDEDSESEVAYVDSVTKWGPWELDIEPAAGGLTPASTGVLNARGSKVTLRTNSIAALAPPASPKTPVTFTPSPMPVPVLPTVTPVIPVAPPRPVAPTTFAPPGATPPTNVTFN